MQIHWAAKRGDNAAIERQLRRGIAVDAADREGRTPLMFAIEGRRASLATLQLLVARGADVNAVSSQFHRTPLTLAVESGRPDYVRFLLDSGANLHHVNDWGYTALALATLDDPGHLEVLEMLLQAGASPEVSSCRDEGLLLDALQNGNFAAARMLLKYGASRQSVEHSPLSLAVALGTVDDVVAELRRLGHDANRECARPGPWLKAVFSGDIAKAELLKQRGANLDECYSCDETSLMIAASRNQSSFVRWLLDQGADLQAQNSLGQTALMLAVVAGAADSVRVLLQAGAPLRNPNGEHVIARARDIEVVRVLVAAGADIDAVGDWDAGIPDGEWPLNTAADMGDLGFARQLLELGADPCRECTGRTALLTAAAHDQLEIVQLLIDHGADVNAEDCDGWTPLSEAVSLECVELLLAAGADIHAQDLAGTEVIGQHRDPEIIERLRAAGGSLESPAGSLSSLMITAAQEGNAELIDYLLQQGVDANVPTELNLTPLMAAAERGHIAAVRRLLAAGVDVHAREYRGRTTLFYAAAPETGIAFEIYQMTERTRRLYMDDMFAQFPESMREKIANTPGPILPMSYRPSDDVTAIDLLIAAGADLEALDAEGATPLLVTCRYGRPSRVARLLQLGANKQAIDDQGRMAGDWAAEHLDELQRAEILELLRRGQ